MTIVPNNDIEIRTIDQLSNFCINYHSQLTMQTMHIKAGDNLTK